MTFIFFTRISDHFSTHYRQNKLKYQLKNKLSKLLTKTPENIHLFANPMPIKLSDYLLGGMVVSSLASAYVIYQSTKENDNDSDDDSYHLPSPVLQSETKKDHGFRERLIGDLDASFTSFDGNQLNFDFEEEGKQVFRICITGGQSSGRRTCITYLNERLSTLGYKVFMVPNVTALTRTAGFDVFDKKMSKKDQIRAIVSTQERN